MATDVLEEAKAALAAWDAAVCSSGGSASQTVIYPGDPDPKHHPKCECVICNCVPAIRALIAEHEALLEQKDGAYLERNHLVALLATMLPSKLQATRIEGWSPEWDNCVYITLPDGSQASWHYHDDHAHLFEGLSGVDAGTPPLWDGHTTEEKYERIRGQLSLGMEGPTDAD